MGGAEEKRKLEDKGKGGEGWRMREGDAAKVVNLAENLHSSSMCYNRKHFWFGDGFSRYIR